MSGRLFGNDPNFLQWSGWVRDHLGGSARRIYLVGVLNLPAAARRLLEQRNVAPIDLAPLVTGSDPADRHLKANRLFLEFLRAARPKPAHAWSPDTGSSARIVKTPDDANRLHTDKAYGAQVLDESAKRWQTEREQYPGWLICPEEKRRLLRYGTNEGPMPTTQVLEHVKPERRPRVLFELAWRFEKAFWPIPPFLLDPMQEAASPRSNSGLALNEHLHLAIAVLRSAREHNDHKRFDAVAGIILSNTDDGSDYRAALAYQNCLWLKDRLEYANLLKELASVAGTDPIWKMRQASLFCDLGEFEKAEALVTESLNELRERQYRDRSSLWVLSRRAWAEFLTRAADIGARFGRPRKNDGFDRDRDWPLDFKAAKCDPWDELRGAEADIDKTLRERAQKTFDVKAHFDAGVFTEGNTSTNFQSWTSVSPNYTLDRLCEDVGLPISFGWINIHREQSKSSLVLSFDASEEWYLRLLGKLHSQTDAFVDQYLGRVPVARLPDATVTALLGSLSAAIEFWRSKALRVEPGEGHKLFDTHAIEQIRLFVEAASRLVIRADSAQAMRFYDFAIAMVKDPDLRHWWLLEPLGHLMQRSGEAMPPAMRGELALSAIQFPLRAEGRFAGPERYWPTPLMYIAQCDFKRPQGSSSWNNRISELIEAVRSEVADSRQDAALRLCYLDEKKLLTDDERKYFSEALYSQRLPGQLLPAKTHLYPFAFLRLPSPDPSLPLRYFTEILFKKTGNELLSEDVLISIGAGAEKKNSNSPVIPDRNDALRMLDEILAWQPATDSEPFVLDRQRPKRLARKIGPCLARAILPPLNADDLTEDRVEKLFHMIAKVPIPSALQCLPLVVAMKPELEGRTVKAIQRAIAGNTFDEIAGAGAAIIKWTELTTNGRPVPRSIISHLVAAVTARRQEHLSTLIWCAIKLLELGLLTKDDQNSIAEALSDLLIQTNYDRVDEPKLMISLSILRAQCAKLAQKLAHVGIKGEGISAWLEAYKNDQLPEVRFALLENDEPSAEL